MEVIQCVRCKKLFQHISGPPICYECKAQEEKDFDRVKEYLKEHPRATLSEVAEETEVSVERITKFLKEGRLEITQSSGIMLKCEKCGRPIPGGRLCKACSSQLKNDLQGSYNELKEKGTTSGSLMRYLREDEEKK